MGIYAFVIIHSVPVPTIMRDSVRALSTLCLNRMSSFVDWAGECDMTVADQSLEILAGLLNDRNVNTVKVTVQCFPTVYALLFCSL